MPFHGRIGEIATLCACTKKKIDEIVMITISLTSAMPSTRAEISTSKYARQTTSATPINASQSQFTPHPYCPSLTCA